ncbi:phytoene/squalene synthase family protein [Altererythrobacter xixiisoli]|uniref:Phytoene/squalene synthase family protein n=1 Tax=Croceibacterium xixiisoli TaxID=1476466 RepID=A0A6I4TWY3_9SPHN|nr:phytoene/squalene synthase family protein [Croceibacterium xixiisoli]MXP00505.1 phytoene/squalene synthase family protein [Croceibacterium xixiisoli]
MARRPRLLAPSRILRTTPRQIGGGRPRPSLVEQARESINTGSASHALASKLFDKETRERAWLLFAWRRRCNDIAGGRGMGSTMADESDPHDRIEAIRVLSLRALDGQPTADVAFDAFGQVSMEAGLDEQLADDVIEGFALDADRWQPRDQDDLLRYCYHTAGAAGVMMARIMRVDRDDNDALDRACDMGIAFRLIDIARDLARDDALGRCHLPVHWLAEAGIPAQRPLDPVWRGQLAQIAVQLIALADIYAAAGRQVTTGLSFRQRWAVLSIANIFAATGQKVIQRGEKAWDKRIRLSPLGKLTQVTRALGQALRSQPALEEWPPLTRGQILIAVRMTGPIPPVPMTPLPDEELE